MQAALRYLHSPDVHDLATYVPEDGECFGFLVQAMFGPRDEPGEESFDILVCTPAWLARHGMEGPIATGRHHLFMRAWDLAALTSYIEARGRAAEGKDWHEIAVQLARLGKWEFEDYRCH